MSTRVLTGITTTGTPHLGNYAGAIRPAIRMSREPDTDAFFFMADYHALIKCDEPERVSRSRLEIAAAWLSAGLDVDKVTFYRQSDLPEILELCWMLTCITPKGLMNRAHAYKASVDQNLERNLDPDDGVSMGLFSYPVLMAADILMFNAHKVPVGRDQVQHLEMTRDIAARFNQLYGRGRDFFVMPEAQLEEEVALLPGLDGRKMSKSYNNTIPLFEGGAKATRAAVMRIVTDSRQPGEPKDALGSHLYTLFRAFATEDQLHQFRVELEEGMGWGEAKERLVQQIETELAPMRDTYAQLMATPDRIEEVLQAGAEKARRQSSELMRELRAAIGFGQASVLRAGGSKKGQPKSQIKKPRFVSFQETEGQFRFRLIDADGTELLVSEVFSSPREAGRCIRLLQDAGLNEAVLQQSDKDLVLIIEGQVIARLDPQHHQALKAALAAF